MAVLYITEYSSLAMGGGAQIATDPPIAEQTVAIGAGSLQSAPFNTATRYIRLQPDVVCSIAAGANPTATATNRRMSAGQTEYFGVVAGNRVAVITNT